MCGRGRGGSGEARVQALFFVLFSVTSSLYLRLSSLVLLSPNRQYHKVKRRVYSVGERGNSLSANVISQHEALNIT